MVPYEFARLIQSQHGPTLVIVAHFAAATSCLKQWWTREWGRLTINGIDKVIEPGLREWLDWPMRQMEDEMTILIA